MPDPVAPTDRPGVWRTGRKVGRTLYVDDELVGVVDTPELAQRIVDAVNGRPERGGVTGLSWSRYPDAALLAAAARQRAYCPARVAALLSTRADALDALLPPSPDDPPVDDQEGGR